jgi:hypothetical protein
MQVVSNDNKLVTEPKENQSILAQYTRTFALAAACFSPFVLSGCKESLDMSTPAASSPDSIERADLPVTISEIYESPSKFVGRSVDLSSNDSPLLYHPFTFKEKVATRFNTKSNSQEEFQIWHTLKISSPIEILVVGDRIEILVVGDRNLSTEHAPSGVWSKDSEGRYFLDARAGLGKPSQPSNSAEINSNSKISF